VLTTPAYPPELFGGKAAAERARWCGILVGGRSAGLYGSAGTHIGFGTQRGPPKNGPVEKIEQL
jgi:hypothetical protein